MVNRSPDEHDFRRPIGRRLHLRRTWLRQAQQDIADNAGVTRNFVSAIERGTQGLDVWRLRLVADAIGATLDWLLFGPDDEVTDPEPGSRPHRWYPPTTDIAPSRAISRGQADVTSWPTLAPPLAEQPGGADDVAAVDGLDPEVLRDEVRFRAEVGWRLRKLRTWNDDLSQDELARRAGVTRNVVSAIERGAQGLDAWRLWRIAEVLGVPLGVLLCLEPLPLTRTKTRTRYGR